VRASLLELFPGQRLRPVSLQSDLVTGDNISGFDMSKVRYRPYVIFRIGAIDSPRLLTLSLDGEPRILLSNDDMSYGMLRQNAWGVYGYTSDSAYKLMTNFVLSANK